MGSYPRARVQGEWSPAATPVKGGEIQISFRVPVPNAAEDVSKLWNSRGWKKKKKWLPLPRQKRPSDGENDGPIVFRMTEHVIVSFTYNCNNDALVRVLNYLFIVSCGSSERLIWISGARVNRKGWWKLSPRIKITPSDDESLLHRRCINFHRFDCTFVEKNFFKIRKLKFK